MDDIMEQKQHKDRIMKVLYDNRIERWPLNSDQIKKSINDLPLTEQQVRGCLLELIDEGLVKVEKGMPIKVPNVSSGSTVLKSPVETIPVADRYRISTTGINYVENGFVKPQKSPDIDKLIKMTQESGELLKEILEQRQVPAEDQEVQSQLLQELQKALNEKDEARAKEIIKESLDKGKEIAVPLMVEYIKAVAKSLG